MFKESINLKTDRRMYEITRKNSAMVNEHDTMETAVKV